MNEDKLKNKSIISVLEKRQNEFNQLVKSYVDFYSAPLKKSGALSRINKDYNFIHELLHTNNELKMIDLFSEMLIKENMWKPFGINDSNMPPQLSIETIRDRYILVEAELEFDCWVNSNYNKSKGKELALTKALYEYEHLLKQKILKLEGSTTLLAKRISNGNLLLKDKNYFFSFLNPALGDCAHKFKKKLEYEGYLKKETDSKIFNMVFRFPGKEVSTKKISSEIIQLVWLGGISHLKYFIQHLIETKKIENKNHWVAVEKCFVDRNGNKFSAGQLRKTNGKNISERIKTKLNDIADVLPSV